MTASLKMRQLESKISELQKQHQLLLKERQQKIAALLTTVGLAHLDDKTLMGGLLFLKEKITTQDPMLEAWHVAGEKFLRQHRPKLSSRYWPHKGRKQGGSCSQSTNQGETYSETSGKKGAPPTPTRSSQTTDQPLQEHP